MNRRTKQIVTILVLAFCSFVASAGALAQDASLAFINGQSPGHSLTVGPINLTVNVTLAAAENKAPMMSDSANQLVATITNQFNNNALKAVVLPGHNGAGVLVTGHSEDLSNLYSPALTNLYDFDVSIDPGKQLSTLIRDCVTVTIYRADGTATTLTPDLDPSKSVNQPVCASSDTNKTWRLSYDDAPIALLEIDGRPNHYDGDKNDCKYASDDIKAGVLFEKTCRAQYLLARSEVKKDQLILGMELEGGTDSPVLSVKPGLSADIKSEYTVNGDSKIIERAETSIRAPDRTWTIDWQSQSDGCRAVSARDGAYASLVLKVPEALQTQFGNGIVVGKQKVFDVVSLQRMLNTTASQLAAISGFNTNSINAAFGNLQGITRDTSYLNAQLTTAPTASIGQQNTLGVNTPNTTQTTTPIGSTTVTLQCPDGSLPAIGSSTTLGGCTTVPVTGATPNVPAYAPITPVANGGSNSQGVLTTTPAGSTVTNNGYTTNSQNQTTTTTPSVSGMAPSALNSNTLTPPSNVGVASADILAEQVQLNSQITTLRLLLQGALSDQYLLKNSRAVGEQQQTTLGLTVALDPPRQFKHAVAEVRIIIVPTGRSDSPSIMNLLPLEKTYNVAKVTSNQKAFGAGAVIEPVSFGISTGTSKDRLYLAKDTDTLALQFPLPVEKGDRENVGTPFPQKVHDIVKAAVEFQKLGGCAWDKAYSTSRESLPLKMEREVTEAMVYGSQPISFGWQFRPVLGEDYVQGGERQVFAQLALGTGLSQSYVPDVYVETVWREYDPKRQVVGAEYQGSCSLAEQAGGVDVLSQPTVRNVSVSDLGGGQLKLSATGNFYTSSLGVLSGQNTLSSVFFDGATLEFFGNAHDLMEGGDLKIIGQNGQNSPFGIVTDPQGIQDRTCGISSATMRAVPRPDGNSRVYLDLTLGSKYRISADEDGEPNPLVLINGQVYGLRESPFINDPEGRCPEWTSAIPWSPAVPAIPVIPARCHYEFLAPTTNLRNGQTFLVRDLAWDQMQFAGTTQLLPSFTAATALAPSAPSITTQPTSQVVTTGQKATFSVVASGTEPLTYQWAKNAAITGATSSNYTTPPAESSDNGTRFTVIVSNSAGSVTSSAASLKVNAKTSANPAPDPPLGKSTTDDADTSKSTTTAYEISGYDFTSIAKPCNSSKPTFDSPCRNVYYDSISLDESHFKVVSDNLAIVDGVPAGAKTLRFQIYWDTRKDVVPPDPIPTTEWDLTLPKTADENKSTGENNPSSIAGSPAILHVGDSQTVTFTSPTFANCPAGSLPVTFDGVPLPGNPGNCDPKKKNMVSVLISTAITKIPGHKELTVTVPPLQGGGTPQPTTLTFDVVKE